MIDLTSAPKLGRRFAEDKTKIATASDRILKLPGTVAGLDGTIDIDPQHVTEAIHYRNLDRTLWNVS